MTGENAGDYAGWSVAGGGDINGDGQNDVLVSAIKNSDNGDKAGKVYLFFNLFASITISQPNGGETLAAATDYEIQWESNNIGDMVSIEYSPDGGATWTTIAENTANDGSFLWHVPLVTSDSCLVRISDASSGTADQSDALFSIEKMQHFTPAWQNTAIDLMAYFCAELDYLDYDLEPDDEIGVFDDTGESLNKNDVLTVTIWQHRTDTEIEVPEQNMRVLDTQGNPTGKPLTFAPMSSVLLNISVKNNTTQELPADFKLYRNYPNPFNSSTTISYDLPTACHLSLRIYDVNGHLVKILQNGHQTAGHHSISWDGTNKNKVPVVSGLYFVRLHAEGFERVGKVMVVR